MPGSDYRVGQGGWQLGDSPAAANEEKRALRLGLELGMRLIDTAEMYGDGRSERLIADALRGVPRDEYTLCSKVYPHNAGMPAIFRSCENSLRCLGTDYLDLYLLHWRGSIPLQETVAGMEELVRMGKIKRWGVSNFDVSDMEELWSVPGGDRCAANQVLYHIGSRGAEYDLLPWLGAHDVTMMAYCPLAQGGRLRRTAPDFSAEPTLLGISGKYGVSVFQIMLAFVLRQPGTIAIPKAGKTAHTRQNAEAAQLARTIAIEDWKALDGVYWPPTAKMHLDIE